MLVKNYKNNTNILIVTELTLSQFNPKIVRLSGQVFRMTFKESDSVYKIVSGDKYVTFSYIGNDSWLFDCTMNDWKTYWSHYFNFSSDYELYNYKIEESPDEFLKEALKVGRGMRILKQDLWETMVSFIISQQNNIPKIQKTVELLSEKFGTLKTKKIYRDYWTNEPLKEPQRVKYYAFPTYVQIANLSLSELESDTMLGYRAKYILKLAQDVQAGEVDLKLLERKLDKSSQVSYLENIFGIGPKVANCIALYGLHNMTCYPIDVWMERLILEDYLKSDSDKLTEDEKQNYLNYINKSYLGFQGYIQQLQFYYKRYLSTQKNK